MCVCVCVLTNYIRNSCTLLPLLTPSQVMGTDMSNHFSIMGDFHAKVGSSGLPTCYTPSMRECGISCFAWSLAGLMRADGQL